MNAQRARPGPALRLPPALLALALLAPAMQGCVSIGGGDAPARAWYELSDAGAAQAGRAVRSDPRVLLLAVQPGSAFYDSTAIAWGRTPDTRAYYQFAAWTDRPAQRVAVLLERRLSARGGFAAVAQSTSGVRGQLLLNVSLDELWHDASAEPGAMRIAASAELIDWRTRALVARRSFSALVPVNQPAAAAAAAASNRAVAALLDELAPWVEESAGRSPVSR